MNCQWLEKILDQLEQKRIGPFYVVTSPTDASEPIEFLKNWADDLKAHYLSKQMNLPLKESKEKIPLGHGDFLDILPPENQDYKVDDEGIKAFFKAQSFGTLELKHKLIFIHSAHLISENIANKMLKTLEEPQEDTTIFFLKPNQSPLLATIESRAIKIQLKTPGSTKRLKTLLSPNQKKQWFLERFEEKKVLKKHLKDFEKFLETPEQTHGLLGIIKKDILFREEFLKLLLTWHCESLTSYQKKQAFLEEIKWFNQAKTFHNNTTERFYGLLQLTFQA